jgi:hypothetical protein
MDEGYELKQVDLAENGFEDETQIGLGLHRTDQRTEDIGDQMVLNLFTSYNVIEARGRMLRVIKEKE